MILNFIEWDVKPQIIDLGSFEIRWYSVLFASGFIIGYYILKSIFKREGIKVELLDKLTIYAVIGTILGARFGHCLFYEPENYLKTPWKIILPFEFDPNGNFQFTGYQGLASHGGAIGVFLAMYFFSRKAKLPFIWVLDRVALVTALAGVFIRLGNLFNSEIYGRQTDLPFGFIFIRNSEIVAKHPTQVYEALAYLLIFVLLTYLYFKNIDKLKPGLFTGWFFILLFTARFFIEFIKEDQVDFEKGMALNMGQILSIPFIIAGLLVLLFVGKKQDKKETSSAASGKKPK